MKFFRLFIMFLVILRSFYIIYVEISCHLIVPLINFYRESDFLSSDHTRCP